MSSMRSKIEQLSLIYFDAADLLTIGNEIDVEDDDFKLILDCLRKAPNIETPAFSEPEKTVHTRCKTYEKDVGSKCILKDHRTKSDFCIETSAYPEPLNIEDSQSRKSLPSSHHTIQLSQTPRNSESSGLVYKVYPDYSKTSIETLPKINYKNMRGRGQENFPKKLFKILERSDAGDYSSLISWLPHGRAFKIHNEDLFFNHIVKKYFLQKEIKSFKHQLYVYGFRKIGKRHPDVGAYYHEFFIRDRYDLCSRVIRLDCNASAIIGPTPDFYEMPIVPSQSNSEVSSEPKIVEYKNSNFQMIG